MFYVRRRTDVTVKRSAITVNYPRLKLPLDRERDYGPPEGCCHRTRNSQQVWCRELASFADEDSERLLTANPVGDRVDFIPKGISSRIRASDWCQRLRVRFPLNLGPASKYLSVWSFGVELLRSSR